MKIIKSYTVIFLCFLFGNTFAQTADITEGCFPLEVHFTAPPGTTFWYWDFKDGASSTLENPVNTFTTAGTFEVEFSQIVGGPVEGTVTIAVYPKVDIEITANPVVGCAPLNVAFQNQTQIPNGVTATNYEWVFGDGESVDGIENPSHTFNTAGSFFVSVSVETNLATCNITEVFEDIVNISAVPDVNFAITPDPATACEPPLTVSFTNNSTADSPLSYTWDFGNGTTSTDVNPPSVTYTENGEYTITLTGIDENSCPAVFTQTVNIGEPVANFIVPGPLCVGELVRFENLSPIGFMNWNFGPEAVPMTSVQYSPFVVFNEPGSYDVTLSMLSIDGQCSDDTTMTVVVELADASFETDPSYACYEPVDITYTPNSSDLVSWQWVFQDQSTSSDPMPVHTFINPDTTTYGYAGEMLDTTFLTGMTASGCVAIFMNIDTFHLPNALFFPDILDGCAPLTVELKDSSSSREDILTWEWIYGDGNTAVLTNDDPHNHTFTDPGEYYVQLIIVNAAGCRDTSFTRKIVVGHQIVPDFEVDKTVVCPGEEVNFTSLTNNPEITDWHYTTDGGRLWHCHDEPNPSHAFATECGPMDVTLTVGYNGCYTSSTKLDLIRVKGPIAQLNFATSCTEPYTVAFTNESCEATNVLWDFGDGNTSTNENPEHTYTVTGDYVVTLMAENDTTGCAASVDDYKVFIRDLQAGFTLQRELCIGEEYALSGGMSQDVNAFCSKGYTWFFSHPDNRPVTTSLHSVGYAFDQPGEQTVTLMVEDVNGCFDTAHTEVKVYEVRTDFAADDSLVCLPADIQMTNLSTLDTTLASYVWIFGDGQTSMDENPLHNYNNVFGSQVEVTLVTTDVLGCESYDSLFIDFYDPFSSIALNPVPAQLCTGESISFTGADYTTGGSFLNFNWDFGNGTTAQGQQVSTTFAEGGIYPVKMIFEEDVSGCTDSLFANVQVQDFPEAGFQTSVDDLEELCFPLNVFFMDTTVSNSPLTHYWDFGNMQTATGADPATVYGKGTFLVQMIATTSFGCTDTAYREFKLVGPEGDFVIDQNTICKGDEITFMLVDTADIGSYTWVFGDGSIAENISPVAHPYNFHPPSGQTVAKLILRGEGDACPISLEQPIFIHDVIADFIRNNGLDTAICYAPYPLDDLSFNADQISWDFGDGTFGAGITEVHNFPSPGTYEVSLAVTNEVLGCVDTITKTVILYDKPDVKVKGDTICAGDTSQLLVLNYNKNSIYTWTPAEGLSNPNIHNPLAFPAETVFYNVEEENESGCSDTASLKFTVIQPLADMEWDTTVVLGDYAILPIENTGDYLFEWTPEEGLSCLNCSYPEVQGLEDMVYELAVKDIYNCFESEFVFRVNVFPETFIQLPTTFTPNGDNINDVIYVEGWGIKELLLFEIYNRWGEKVYEGTDITEGWNGYYKGVLQNNDVYVYKVLAETWKGGETIAKEGHINLAK